MAEPLLPAWQGPENYATGSATSSASLPVNGGYYYTTGGSASAPFAMGQNRLYAHALEIKTTSLDELAVVVTTLQAGSSIRVGVYADDGYGRPGALVDEADTPLDSTATGVKTATIAAAVTGPIVWLAAVAQGSATGPSVRNVDLTAKSYGMPTLTTGSLSSSGFYQDSISGALPATWGATYASLYTGGMPRLWARVASF